MDKNVLRKGHPVSKEILESGLTLEQANERETFYIEPCINNWWVKCWNVARGGGNSKRDGKWNWDDGGKAYRESNKKQLKAYQESYHQTSKYKAYQKTYRQTSEHNKTYRKAYRNQLCKYNDETLTLNALTQRFIKQGVLNPTLEAKKYLLGK